MLRSFSRWLFCLCSAYLFASTSLHAEAAASDNPKPQAKFDTIQEFRIWLSTVHNFNGLLKYKFHNWLETVKTTPVQSTDLFEAYLQDPTSEIFSLAAGTEISVKFIVGKGWILLTASPEIEEAALTLTFKTDEVFLKKSGRTLLVSSEIGSEAENWIPFENLVNQLIRTAFLQHTAEDATSDLTIQVQLP